MVFDFALLFATPISETVREAALVTIISNRKPHKGIRLEQKSMTVNDLERQFTVCRQSMSATRVYCDKMAEARITRFSLKSCSRIPEIKFSAKPVFELSLTSNYLA